MKFIVLASGTGSTLEALLSMQSTGLLHPQICAFITDNPQSGALQIAHKFNISTHCVSPKSYQTYAEWDAALLSHLVQFKSDFILLAGFLKKIGPLVLKEFHNKIINTHPSLLPKYGGKGMYGRHVHEAVLNAHETKTGVTIHRLNEKFDEGPILTQVEVPVLSDDSVASLENRVKLAERKLLVDFLNNFKG